MVELLTDVVAVVLVAASLPFFVAGAVGVLRFPDVYMRLHALTKADNVGLGLLTVGLAVQQESFSEAATLLLVWALVLVASTTAAHLVGRSALREGVEPWKG